MTQRQLIVGLGNPGPRYAATRHNAGFLVLDVLAERMRASFKSHKARCDVVEGLVDGAPVVLAKPHSFMNESGGPVVAVARFYKVPVESITVVHDDLDLPFGALRVKRGGGEGGHNGLRSMSAALGSTQYARVRFGVGRPPGRQDPADYVLREFTALERKDLEYLLDRAADATTVVVTAGLQTAQNQFNGA